MKILALDGGGVFGKVQAEIISRANCLDKFDCFVGTSIGSCLSAIYAVGLSLDPNFFDINMPIIFDRPWYRKLNPLICKYPDNGLNSVLQNLFTTLKLSDVKKPLFVVSADVKNETLKVFNYSDPNDSILDLWQVIRSATAAETYFPLWKNYADGGVFANNPSMVAVAVAVNILKVQLSDIEIFSIGTGSDPANGGKPDDLLDWGEWLLHSLLNGDAELMHDYFVRSLPIGNYTRIQFKRDPSWTMDDSTVMNTALQVWSSDISDAVEAMQSF